MEVQEGHPTHKENKKSLCCSSSILLIQFFQNRHRKLCSVRATCNIHVLMPTQDRRDKLDMQVRHIYGHV